MNVLCGGTNCSLLKDWLLFFATKIFYERKLIFALHCSLADIYEKGNLRCVYLIAG